MSARKSTAKQSKRARKKARRNKGKGMLDEGEPVKAKIRGLKTKEGDKAPEIIFFCRRAEGLREIKEAFEDALLSEANKIIVDKEAREGHKNDHTKS